MLVPPLDRKLNVLLINEFKIMFLRLLFLLMYASKRIIHVFLIQVIAIQLLMANVSNSQRLENIKLDFAISNASLEDVFLKLGNETGFIFGYGHEIISIKDKISLQYKNESLHYILEGIARANQLRFKRINDNILVSKEKTSRSIPVITEAEDVIVNGKVIDAETREPLVGAAVQVKGTSFGIITDIEGSFTLSVPEEAEVLSISYIGYESQEIQIGNQTSFEIYLQLDLESLDEIVVVGYGSQTKSNLTGSVAKVEGSVINQRPITQGSQALQGLTAGVFINANSGEPGNDNSSITIRGLGTLNDTEPLVLIDGIEAPLDNINPQDIESVNILKDAASASIYGTRGANGVILITTKRGQVGKPMISYNNSFSTTSPAVDPDLVLDTRTYLETYVQAAAYSGRNHRFTPELIDELTGLGSTNWYDEFVGHGFIQDHDLAISGGSEKVRYRFSNRYFDQEGFLKGDWYNERFSSRLNLDMTLNEKLRAGASFSYINTDTREAPKGDPNRNYPENNVSRYSTGKGNYLYTILLASAPNAMIYDEFGRYSGTGGESSRSQRENPQGIVDNQWIDTDINEMFGNAYLEYEPIQDLNIRYTTGVNFIQDAFQETRLEYRQYDRFGNRTSTRNNGSRLKTRQATRLNFTNWLQINYKKTINNHKIGLMVGFNQESSKDQRLATFETGFGTTSLVQKGLGTVDSDIENYDSEWALQSVFGRVNYGFKNKYLLELNVRRDGSSRFGSNNRYATFPGVSAGYVLSNEAFWNVGLISFLKLRASWGIVGVQSSRRYPYASEVTLGNDYNGNSGAALVKFGNPDLQWEEITTTDFGLDLELLDGRVYLEADYFRKVSEGILTQTRNPLTSGISSSTTINSASIMNKGWELTLRTNNTIGALRISTNFNISHLDNEVTQINPALADGAEIVNLNGGGDRNIWLIKGQPINAIYGHAFGGIFQTDEFNNDGTLRSGVDYSPLGIGTPRPGDIKFVDENGDGVIDEKDRSVIGDRNPEWLYGFNLNMDYKGFDLGLFFQGVGNMNSWVNRYTGNFGHSGLRSFWLNGWTEENPSNTVPRLFVDRDGFNGRTLDGGQPHSEFWVIDQSYLRLKNIVLGYSLPKNVLDKLSVQQLRIYVSGQNLWTRSDMKDLDPERNQLSNHFGGTLPQAKSYTVGLNITF